MLNFKTTSQQHIYVPSVKKELNLINFFGTVNINLFCYMDKAPVFIECCVPPAVALAGPDEKISRAGRFPPLV